MEILEAIKKGFVVNIFAWSACLEMAKEALARKAGSCSEETLNHIVNG